MVHKDFVKGSSLKSGMFIDNHLRPYKNQTNGVVQITMINFSEISVNSGMSKDASKAMVYRMIRIMADKTRKEESVEMLIPAVGNFLV